MEQPNTEIPTPPQPENIQSVPVSPPPQKSKLPMVLVVVVLLILFTSIGIVLGKYVLNPTTPPVEKLILPSPSPAEASAKAGTPTPASTVYTEGTRSANWKTYTNPKYNYSIKYPNNLLTKVSTTENQLTFTESPEGQWLYDLSVENNSKNLTLNDIKQQELDKLGISKTDIQPEINEITTQNAKFQILHVISAKQKPFAIAVAFTIKGTNIYYFYANSNKEQFDQILSTFKFLE